jgi:hypothetical protein
VRGLLFVDTHGRRSAARAEALEARTAWPFAPGKVDPEAIADEEVIDVEGAEGVSHDSSADETASPTVDPSPGDVYGARRRSPRKLLRAVVARLLGGSRRRK